MITLELDDEEGDFLSNLLHEVQYDTDDDVGAVISNMLKKLEHQGIHQ